MTSLPDPSGLNPLSIGETAASDKDWAGVFISYRRANRNFADCLYRLLKERNVAAWYDPLIPHGTDWREAIVKHLSTARVMVVLLSSDALESDELRKELAVAVQERVPLVPVRLEDVQPQGAFAYELARSNWFDIFDDPATCLPALADLLREMVNNPHGRSGNPEDVLQMRPQQWRKLVGHRRSFDHLMGNNTLLFTLLVVISALQFLFYERMVGALEQLTISGVMPLRAFLYVLLVATVGSPLLLLSRLQHGLSVEGLPLLVTAAANTLIIILLVRNFFSWIHHRFRAARTTK